ncbi:MAG: ABC-type transport auxiliary lipoprotein family protein [Thermodesulfobacteriota bacterium]
MTETGNRRIKTGWTLLLLLVMGLFCGCVNLSELTQTGVEMTYYTLEYEPTAAAADKIDRVLKVNRFTAAPLFASKKIVYKQKDFQTGEYLYHQWHVAPTESIASLLARDMSQSGLFAVVLDPAAATPAAFSVSGNLEVCLEDNTRRPWEAVLSLGILLTDETEPDISKRVLMQKVYTATEPCARKNPRATAEAMSRALQKISMEIVRDVYGAIKERTRRSD